ncbi:hypothetical protein NL676_008963 [Syzygium grande]|nr:hypothetical protein NL676_008963 [Syzygium grande]
MEPPISRAPPPLPPSPTTTKTLAATATRKTTITASRASSPATGQSRKAFRLGKFGQVLNQGQLLHHQLLLPQLPQLQLFLLAIDPPRRRDLDALLDARLVLPQPPQIPNFQVHAPNVPDELRPRFDLRQNTQVAAIDGGGRVSGRREEERIGKVGLKVGEEVLISGFARGRCGRGFGGGRGVSEWRWSSRDRWFHGVAEREGKRSDQTSREEETIT